MTKIISMSLNEEILKEIDSLQKEMGFSGRSEVIRAGVRMLLSDYKEKSNLTGKIDGTLIVIHNDKYSQDVSKIRHNFTDIVKTQIHNHLENHKCLEIFVLSGNSDRIKMMLEEFQINKNIDLVKLIIA